MSFDFLINLAKHNNLVYELYEFEAFFVPIGRNYFTRIRTFDNDFYIEYCDDYKKPLNDLVKVVRINYSSINYDVVIINHILQHPKNIPEYYFFWHTKHS
jgi:hypothetical protein